MKSKLIGWIVLTPHNAGFLFFQCTQASSIIAHYLNTGNDRYSGDRYSGIDRFSGTKASDENAIYLLQTTILVETTVIVEQKPLTVFSTITVVACTSIRRATKI